MIGDTVLQRDNGFRQVVLATGHVTDAPTRRVPRFPETEAARVAETIHDVLDGLGFGPEDLLICGGARGGDLLAAEAARACGATVWLLLAHPPERFVEGSVRGGAAGWVDTFWHVAARCPLWVLDTAAEGDAVYAAANEWMLEVAQRQAPAGRLVLLAVWNGAGAEGPGGTSEMVQRTKELGGDVIVIHPLAETTGPSS